MIFLKYIVNLSVFSIFVIIPLVIPSFFNYKPVKRARLWVGLYAGIFTCILVVLSIKQRGYSFDLRFASVILVFAYLGPVAGLITGGLASLARLYVIDNWYSVILGWTVIMVCFTILHFYISRFTAIKRVFILFGTYTFIYFLFGSIFYKINNQPFLHLEYLLLMLFGVIIATFLIESYFKMFRLNNKLTYMYRKVDESESNFRLIAENTLDLFVVIDHEFSIHYYSPSHRFVLGYEDSELAGTQFSKLIHPDDVSTIKFTLNGMIKNKNSQIIEFRIQHKKGYWIDLESRCMPVMGEDQTIQHIVVISRDISERKKSEEMFLQSEKLSIVGELAASVAHEIRNPLTTIKGFVQLYMKENYSVDYSDLLLNELERIETITSELLSLGKPQAIQFNRIDVKELIENTLELLTPHFHMNDIRFKLVVEQSSIYITCEKNQLRQVFLNVLKNALEAMDEGGEIHITLRKSSNSKCIISFQDQGCGIPEEMISRLGEPFYTLKEKGTGLGLMVCHKIIKQHNGKITYHSKVNEGTLIEITLPIAS